MHIEMGIEQPKQTKNTFQLLLHRPLQSAHIRKLFDISGVEFVQYLIRAVVSKNLRRQYRLQSLRIGLDLGVKPAELVQGTDNAEAQRSVTFQQMLHQHVCRGRCSDLYHDRGNLPSSLDSD